MNWKNNNDLLVFQRTYDIPDDDFDMLCYYVVYQHYKEDVSFDTSGQTSDPELLDEPGPEFSD